MRDHADIVDLLKAYPKTEVADWPLSSIDKTTFDKLHQLAHKEASNERE
jgi:hypothetical protein